MSVESVTETFAFVLKNGEFTESILFAEEEIEELKPEERAAIESVQKHVQACYVGLLSECRLAFLDAAGASPLQANRKVLEQNKSRPSTLWNRGMTHVPIVIRSSWVAWTTFGLWHTSNPDRAIEISAHVTTQNRFIPALHDAVRACGQTLRLVGSAHDVGGVVPKEGQTYRELAESLAARALPVAVELYARLAATPSLA